jgi:integrase
MHSTHMLREGARPELVRDNILGHANIDVTQNVYGKSWWEERVDADADRSAVGWGEVFCNSSPSAAVSNYR